MKEENPSYERLAVVQIGGNRVLIQVASKGVTDGGIGDKEGEVHNEVVVFTFCNGVWCFRIGEGDGMDEEPVMRPPYFRVEMECIVYFTGFIFLLVHVLVHK